MYSPRLIITLNAIAHKYQPIIHAAILAVISQPKFSNTFDAANSLIVTVVEGNEQRAPELDIQFADHLLYLDKRKLQWTKLPDIKNLMAWAETKINDPKKAKRLAFAVAWNKKKLDTWKPKPWRKKSLSVVLKEMNELLLNEFAKAIDADLQQGINEAAR